MRSVNAEFGVMRCDLGKQNERQRRAKEEKYKELVWGKRSIFIFFLVRGGV